jgi:NAD(P)-dependent dehydrogenase (short-subunit alcohol dehydrogenase family)
MNIEKQRVVVLGGSSGIGYATAQAAARAGAEVVIASRSPERAAAGLGVRGFAVDLNGSAEGLFAELGEFDHLVYTAGEPLTLMPIADLDVDRARDFFGLRYFGALDAVRAAVPHLRPGGSITLTTGTASQRSSAGWAVGASICGAIEGLTRALAVELAPIRVNAVRPGVTRSPLWGEGADQLYADVAAGLPLRRIGEVADAADAYLYLIGQPFTTGTVVTVDGGALVN